MDRSLTKIVALLRGEDRTLQQAAAHVLGALGSTEAAVLKALGETLSSFDAEVRLACLSALEKLGGGAPLDCVLPLLGEPGDVGHRAMRVVSAEGAKVLPELKKRFADADGRAASETASTTNIAAGVAINVADVQNIATITDASVSGDGVSAEALMADREYDVDPVARTVVNIEENTIFVGEQEKPFVTGTKVKYQNGGGTDIGGLTDNTDYWVIEGEDGFIKLAASESDATDGKAIDLTGAIDTIGDSHALDPEDSELETFTFDPDGSRFEIDFERGEGE